MKNPDRAHDVELSFGRGTVFTQAETERCEAALILDLDPVALVRGPAANALEIVVAPLPAPRDGDLLERLENIFGELWYSWFDIAPARGRLENSGCSGYD